MATVATLTQADRKQWAHNPVTEEFMQGLKEARQEAMEAWAKEAFVGDDAASSAQMNAAALGGIRVLDQVIEDITEFRQIDEEAIQRRMTDE